MKGHINQRGYIKKGGDGASLVKGSHTLGDHFSHYKKEICLTFKKKKKLCGEKKRGGGTAQGDTILKGCRNDEKTAGIRKSSFGIGWIIKGEKRNRSKFSFETPCA